MSTFNHAAAANGQSRPQPPLSLLSIPFEPGLLSAPGWEDGLANLDWTENDWGLAQRIALRATQAQQSGQATTSALL